MKETDVTNHIAKNFGFLTQVKCNAGSIDLLNETSLIECKVDHKRWKEAIGQVISYGQCFPEHEQEIWFFCERNLKVEKLVQALNITCSWFPNGCYGNPTCLLPVPERLKVKPKPKPKELKLYEKPRLKAKKEKGVTYVSSSF